MAQLEAVIDREYQKGGTAGSVKIAVDHALDQLHLETGKGKVEAQRIVQPLIENVDPPTN